MKLYHSPRAPNPERVVMFMRAKGMLDKVELEEVSIMKGEHFSDEYRAISPFAKVPVLRIDDGTAITESRAICTYVEGVFPDVNLLGETPLEKAQIEMWDRQLEFMWMLPFATWFRNTHPAMAPLENPQVPETGAKGEKGAKAFVKRLDAHLADNEFIAAGRFTNSDISAYVFCGFSRVMKWNPVEEHANLARWHAQMTEKGFAG